MGIFALCCGCAVIGAFAMALVTQGKIADLQKDNAYLAKALHEEAQKLAAAKRGERLG